MTRRAGVARGARNLGIAAGAAVALATLAAAQRATDTATAAPRDPHAPLGPVVALAVDGPRLIAASSAGLTVRDREGGGWRALVTLPAGHRPVGFVGSAERGAVAALAPGRGGFVARLGAAGGIALDFEVEALAAGRDGALVVGGADGALRRLTLDDDGARLGAPVAVHAGPCRDLAFAPDGARLAAAGRDGTLAILAAALDAAEDARVVIRDHTASVECVAWSADGAVLASGSGDGRLRFHDRAGRLLCSTPPLGAAVLALTALPTGGFAFGTADGRAARTTAEPAAPIVAIATVGAAVHALATDGATLWIGTHGRVVAAAW